MIQVLPVNDTIANKTWVDSYPYAAISVFALHPLYINIANIAAFKDKKIAKEYDKDLQELNKLDSVDFEKVLEVKWKYLRILFEQEYAAFQNDNEVSLYYKNNEDWLPQYAIFCHLRDKYGICNFRLWPQYADYSRQTIDELNNDNYDDFKEIVFNYFIQFHADRQLTAARKMLDQKASYSKETYL